MSVAGFVTKLVLGLVMMMVFAYGLGMLVAHLLQAPYTDAAQTVSMWTGVIVYLVIAVRKG